MKASSRRRFIRQLGGSAALFSATGLPALAMDEERILSLKPEHNHSPSDTIRVAGIGMGLMGFGDMTAALKVPGVEIAGVCDLYDGHFEHARER